MDWEEVIVGGLDDGVVSSIFGSSNK